jgi:hypothetical protein
MSEGCEYCGIKPSQTSDDSVEECNVCGKYYCHSCINIHKNKHRKKK